MGPPQRGTTPSAKRTRGFASTARPNPYPRRVRVRVLVRLHGLPLRVYGTNPDLGWPGETKGKKSD